MISDNCVDCNKWPTDMPVAVADGSLCVDCARGRIASAESENAKLQNLLRWRSAGAEKPENGMFCLIILRNMAWPNVIQYVDGVPWNTDVITHWRPIGELPGEAG